MRRTLIPLLILLLSTYMVTQGQKNTSPSGKQFAPGRILIKFKPQQNTYLKKSLQQSQAVQSTLQKIGSVSQKAVFKDAYASSEQKRIAEEVGLDRWIAATVPVVTDIENLVLWLKKDPNVEIAEPDYIEKMDAVPNDPLYSQQQHLPQIKASQAWDIQKGDSTVVIAIIDTGVDWDHPDLASVIWTNTGEIPNNGIDDDGDGYIDDVRGWDFVNGVVGGTGTTDPDPNDDLDIPDNNPMDFVGHGTHCSGIAAAATNNATGIASISYGCKVMPLRIGFRTNDGGGSGYSSWMGLAFQYAADKGASVASLSFGTSGQLIVDGALYAFKRGVVICNSAGNGNSESGGVLGTLPWVLSVASVSDLDIKASYSTYGTWVNISAPGGDQNSNRPGILSTIVNPSAFYNNQLYVSFQGTSMACPLVAGLAGLVKSRFPSMNAGDVVLQICATADNIDGLNPLYAGKLGYGRINAQNAVTSAAGPMKPALSVLSVSFNDSLGNKNGKVEPGETIEMTVTFQNDWENATNVAATLSTTEWGINITQASSSYGTIPGIRDVSHSTKSNASNKFVFTVSSDSIPRNVNFKVSVVADQGYARDFTVPLSILPSFLFVDDDDASVNVESYYLNTFRNLGLVCDTWDRTLQGPITANQLSAYTTVVWGCEWAFPSLDSLDRAAIGGFLDNGGQLFISGQDLGWDLCASDGEEYVASGGASKTWFEYYFRSQYQADNAGTTTLNGVPGDPISNGLSLSITEPLRSATYQFPDVITPMSGAQSVFLYPATGAGAIRYASTYKVVYFSFGGFEAITGSAMRDTVMNNIFNWFNGFQFQHTPLKDTESPNARLVQVKVVSGSTIESVNLYYDTDGSFPFQKLSMAAQGGGFYQASIPGQAPSTVQYAVIVRTAAGYAPYKIYSYKVGADIVPPIFLSADSLGSTLLTTGIFTASLSADDNTAIDTTATYMFFKVNGSLPDSAHMQYSAPNNFQGTVDVHSRVSQLHGGDTISYYYSIRDASSAHNVSRWPASGFNSFQIGRQLIDDFQKVKSIWSLGLSWGYEVSTKNLDATNIAMSDSPPPSTPYTSNTENTLTLTQPFDLSAYPAARMYFWRAMAIHTSDTLYVEYQKGTTGWITVRKMNGTFPPTWRKDSVDLPGSSSAMAIRFRLKADGTNQSNGILLDDIEVVGGIPYTGVEENTGSGIPKNFALQQNFPNPFNPTTVISYELPVTSSVRLIVYDMLGREVAVLVNEQRPAGAHTAMWDAQGMPSGVYFYRLTAGSFMSTHKMLMIK